MDHPTIYKFELDIVDKQTIEIPEGSEFLHAGEQHGTLYMWMEIPAGAFYEGEIKPHMLARKEIMIVGTGRPVWGEPNTYLATVQMSTGFVWHVYSIGIGRLRKKE